MTNYNILFIKPTDAIMMISEIFVKNKIYPQTITPLSLKMLIDRDNRSDEDVEQLMREIKVQITILFTFARLPIPEKMHYKIVTAKEINEAIVKDFPFF